MWNFLSQALRSRTRMVAAVTACFLTVALILATLIALTVQDMTASATVIDDARAKGAATAAIRALEARLSATLRDNSVWDDGYRQIMSDQAKDFAESTWGKSSAENPLFDAAIVLAPDHTVLSSFKDGVAFDPLSFLGPSLQEIVTRAETSGRNPIVSFFQTPDGLALIAAGDILPYSQPAAADSRSSTLVFAKLLSTEALTQIEDTFDLDDLKIAAFPSENHLSIPLTGLNGTTLGYLEWPSRNPGAMIYERARGYLLAAALVLATFLVGVLVTGFAAVRLLQRSATQAHHRATHDVLSGLLNRAGFLEQVNRAIAAGNARLRLYLIDLDGFKGVNDTWGHAVGDELIKLVAKRVQSHLPEAALFARLGGDEFAVVAPPEAGLGLSKSLIRCLAEPFLIGGRTIEIGASIGTVLSTPDVAEALELLRRADMALYTAKEAGRGRAVDYTTDLDQDRQTIADLENQLRKAVTDGDIGVAYQPLVDAASGRLRGVEALALWIPETGRISPEIFIPIAEHSGLIDQLGMQVLNTALDHAKQWADLSLSVNVSPVQLRNPNFAADVIELLKQKSFDASRLTLEITEGVLISNPEQAKRAIKTLRDVGIRFALDDFGSGYASIGALRTFGFDRMKIDGSLVDALGKRGGAGVLLATISLALALDIPVTAEGVETQQQADMLKQSGCDQLQGYLLGRPMSAEAIGALMASSSAQNEAF